MSTQLDFLAQLEKPVTPSRPASRQRPSPKQRRGKLAQLQGVAAEETAARHYTEAGARIMAHRWRGPRIEQGCDIDLVVQDGPVTVFVEVKCRRTLDEAAFSITPKQWKRLERAAESYMLREGMGANADMRFDVVLMDRHGALNVIENAQPF